MEEFDDELPTRRFDNFQFVNYEEICRKYPRDRRDTAFAVHALMEVPDQYSAVKKLGLLRSVIRSDGGPAFPDAVKPNSNPNQYTLYTVSPQQHQQQRQHPQQLEQRRRQPRPYEPEQEY